MFIYVHNYIYMYIHLLPSLILPSVVCACVCVVIIIIRQMFIIMFYQLRSQSTCTGNVESCHNYDLIDKGI